MFQVQEDDEQEDYDHEILSFEELSSLLQNKYVLKVSIEDLVINISDQDILIKVGVTLWTPQE